MCMCTQVGVCHAVRRAESRAKSLLPTLVLAPPPFAPETDVCVCAVLAEAERLRGVHRSLQGEVTELERKERDFEKDIGADYGPNMAFEALRHQCADFTPEGAPFTYEMCPFKDARQKPTSVSVGSWVGFGEGGYTEMRFENGTVCRAASPASIQPGQRLPRRLAALLPCCPYVSVCVCAPLCASECICVSSSPVRPRRPMVC
mgnify:CR=1 FL=1